MLKLSLTLSALFVASSLAACSGTTVITTAATDGGPTPSDDAGPSTSDGGANTDASPRADAGMSYGTTAGGASCDPGSFPAATSCSIPGTYDVVESDCSNAACGSGVDLSYEWTAEVTVSGSTVKLTNGTNRQMHCQLTTDCDCFDSGGGLFRFTNGGFVNTGKAQCGTTTAYILSTATKQ